jgi:hypothetical protein
MQVDCATNASGYGVIAELNFLREYADLAGALRANNGRPAYAASDQNQLSLHREEPEHEAPNETKGQWKFQFDFCVP